MTDVTGLDVRPQPGPVDAIVIATAPATATVTAADPASARSLARRELQSRLASKLEVAQSQDRGRAWLAVECGGAGFLLPLAEAGEIFPFRGSVAVPHTRAWFLGVANLRGVLHGVVDLGRFLGLADRRATPADGWLVALNPRLDSSSALRVDRLAGLRREDQLDVVAPEGSDADSRRPRFAGATFIDPAAERRRWQEINLLELSCDAHFLSIAVPP